MSKLKMDLSTNNILTCALYAVIGILLVILQGSSLGILMTIIGILLIAFGVIEIVNGDITKGVIATAIGIVIIVCGWLIADVVLLIFGILMIIMGAIDLYHNLKNGFVAMLSPIVTIVVGVLLVIAKWTLLDLFCIIAGVVFIIDAVLSLFGKPLVKKKKTTRK